MNVTCPSCGGKHWYGSLYGAELSRPSVCPHCGAAIDTSQEPYSGSGHAPQRMNAEPDGGPPARLFRFEMLRRPMALPRIPYSLNALFNRVQSSLNFSDDNGTRIPLGVEIAIVAALTLISLFLRIDDLTGTYPGIYHDEIRSVNLVQRILDEGWVGLFFLENAGMGTGTHYMAVPYFLIGGSGLEMWRLSIAMFGVALIPVAHLLVRHLFNVRIALLTTAMITFCVWFVMQSRIGWDVMPSLFFLIAGLYIMFVGLSTRRIGVAVLAGLVFAVGLYTNKMVLLYFLGVVAVISGTILVNPAMRRRSELYAFLAVALVSGFPMLRFYLVSDYSLTDAAGYYNLDITSIFSKVPEFAANAWNLFLLVHNPIHHPQAEGAGGIPMLRPFIAEIFFWIGLAAALIWIKKPSCRLLIAGWFVSMLPSIVLPDGEARRYVLGMFYILVIVAIGIEVSLVNLVGRVSAITSNGTPIFSGFARWIPVSAAVVVALAFLAFFAADNRTHFNDWVYAKALWHFDHELVEASEYLQTLSNGQIDDYEVRIYSARWPVDHVTLKYILPDLQGVNGSEKFGGDGTVASGGPLTGDTVFLLLDEYLRQEGFAEEVENLYPGGYWHRQAGEDSKPLYAAWVIDAQ